jgi:hypothetical protein
LASSGKAFAMYSEGAQFGSADTSAIAIDIDRGFAQSLNLIS